MATGDIAYYRKRLAEELARESSADTDSVRGVHRRLANLYAERLSALDADGPVVLSLNQTAS